MRRKLQLVAVLALLALLLVACSGPQTEEELVIAQGVDATMLDPGMHSETTTSNVEQQIFDPLIRQDENLEYREALAVSWEATTPTTWEIKLREDVFFHDGEKLKAEDVKYTVDRILDPANNSPRVSNYDAIKEVEIIDDYSLLIHTHESFPILPARLASLRVVPKHYVEEVGDELFKLEPVGSGPYRFVSWDRDEQLVLEANRDYWRGEPAIKRVVFKVIPEDASRVMALQAGQIDVAVNIPPHQVDTVNKSGKAKIASVGSSRFLLTQFVVGKGGPLDDKRVRLALNLAVDVEGIIENLLGGYGTPMSQHMSELDFGYNPDLSPYGYDPQRAKELLKEAGYETGLSLTLAAPSGRYMMDKEVAEAIKSQLEAVGLQVKLTLPEWGVYVDQIMTRKVEADMWLIGWGNPLFDAEGTLYSWFRSGQRFCYYDMGAEKVRDMDARLDSARTNMDVEARERDYQEALATIHAEIPWLLLHQQDDLYGVSNRINWQPRPDESILVYDMDWK